MKQTLIILGVVLLAIAIAVVYFERKLREQNHKIASMFSLVSSLAEELNTIKYNASVCSRDPETIHIGNQLIDVSDDEMELIEEEEELNEASESENESSESENEASDDEDSEEENLSEDEVSIIEFANDELETKKNIKVLKLDLDSDKDQVIDFKKMSVGELRTLALQKGIEVGKLKKGELIDLLSK